MRGVANAGVVAASRKTAAAAQVMVDAVSVGSYSKGAGSPKNTAHAITVDGSKPNRCLLGLFTVSNGGSFNPTTAEVQLTSSVGGAFTQVPGSQQPIPSNLGSVQWRYLLAPANGAHTVTGNYNGSNWADGVALALISLYNVNQAAPFGTPVLSAHAGAVLSNAVTTAVGNLILWGVASSDPITLNQTARLVNLGAADNGYADYTSMQAAAGTGTPVTLTSSGTPVSACSGIPVLAA